LVFGPFEIEYSRFILVAARMRRIVYLVVFAVLVAAIAAGAWRHRHTTAQPSPAKTAAGCDTPAPPPPPKELPKLPDFVEAGCGPAAAKPAPPKK
jgi:hypothetical protein